MPPDARHRGKQPPVDRGGREVIFEFIPIGASMKVTVVDVATGMEVSIIGPSGAAQTELENVAVRKLRYMLEKKEEGKDEPPPDPGPGKGGIIV
ncbi:DUF6898 family protein [Parvibaculum sp.]|uniref:DUF6898 family protein n=1 Tax=Parvibaculum sp. TaxID=2024848 RepID=UPI0039192269